MISASLRATSDTCVCASKLTEGNSARSLLTRSSNRALRLRLTMVTFFSLGRTPMTSPFTILGLSGYINRWAGENRGVHLRECHEACRPAPKMTSRVTSVGASISVANAEPALVVQASAPSDSLGGGNMYLPSKSKSRPTQFSNPSRWKR
jgi:hypothetical protein